MIICGITLHTLVGCGGGGSGSTAPAGNSFQKKAYLTGTSVQNVKGIELTMILPAGVTVPADSSGQVTSGIITMLAPNNSGTIQVGNYTPATATIAGSVKIVIANGTTPFSVGDFFVITCTVDPGVVVSANQFSFMNMQIYDDLGNNVPSANVTATPAI